MKHQNPLMAIPLYRHLIEDPNVEFVPRGIDARWSYDGYITSDYNLSGFNFFENAIFAPLNSKFTLWRKTDGHDIRGYNIKDRLINELFTSIHDYLHIWAYQWIAEISPATGFGEAGVTSKNLEDFAFCHLLSEAVATVGLDYWYLCAGEPLAPLDIGTNFDTLTVSYHLRDIREFRKFNPRFDSQNRQFFKNLVKFYCDGVFHGFDLQSVKQSPKILRWLEHEIVYGETQRIYSREWMIALSDLGIKFEQTKLAAKYDFTKKWRRDLTEELSDLLWEKVVLGKPNFAPKKVHYPYPKNVRFPDPRMLNLNVVPVQAGNEYFEHSFYQALARCDYSDFSIKEKGYLSKLKKCNDIDLCMDYFDGFKRIKPSKKEPPYLFMLP